MLLTRRSQRFIEGIVRVTRISLVVRDLIRPKDTPYPDLATCTAGAVHKYLRCEFCLGYGRKLNINCRALLEFQKTLLKMSLHGLKRVFYKASPI